MFLFVRNRKRTFGEILTSKVVAFLHGTVASVKSVSIETVQFEVGTSVLRNPDKHNRLLPNKKSCVCEFRIN